MAQQSTNYNLRRCDCDGYQNTSEMAGASNAVGMDNINSLASDSNINVEGNVTWPRTHEALSKLFELCKCNLCNKLFEDPIYLGTCDHVFCRACIGKSNTCPSCEAGFYTKEIQDARDIASTLNLLFKLQNHLNSNQSDCNVNNDISHAKDKASFHSEKIHESLAHDDHNLNSKDSEIDKSDNCSSSKNVDFNNENNEAQNFRLLSEKLDSIAVDNTCKNDAIKFESTKQLTSKNVQCESENEKMTECNQPSSSKNTDEKKRGPSKSRSRKKSKERSNITSINKSKKLPNLSKKNAKGETPLHVAVIKNKIEDVKKFLEHGANCNVKDHAGWTPLHEACQNGNVDMVKVLIDNGALPNTPGYDNNTPLHDAVASCRIEVIKILMLKGADVNVRNAHGKSPMDLAITSEVFELLKTATETEVTDLDSSLNKSLEEKIVILYTGINEEQIKNIDECAKIINGRVVTEFCLEVTHLVCACNDNNCCPRTMKYMQCLLTGKWIVNTYWIESCVGSKSKVDEELFEVNGTAKTPDSLAPKLSRINKVKQFPGLFDGCKFYLQGDFNECPLNKDELSTLIKLGDGTVLNRCPKPDQLSGGKHPFHVKSRSKLSSGCFILCHKIENSNKDKNTSGVMTMAVSWLLDCISKFSLSDR